MREYSRKSKEKIKLERGKSVCRKGKRETLSLALESSVWRCVVVRLIVLIRSILLPSRFCNEGLYIYIYIKVIKIDLMYIISDHKIDFCIRNHGCMNTIKRN